MGQRDDFLKSTKNAVAARASWLCSFTSCGRLTVGPSDESPRATTPIGKAAHISGAAPGKGSRRYDPSISPEQRRDIENAIWLCSDHAELIDRDEVTYTVEALRTMKREHEARCAEMIRSRHVPSVGSGLVGVGQNVVFSGDVEKVSPDSWTLRIYRFIAGDIQEVCSFIDGFAHAEADTKYIVSNERGDGRVLSAAPTLAKESGSHVLVCSVAPPFPRIDAQSLGGRMAIHPESCDSYLDSKGNIARVAGVEALQQHIESVLGLQQGESPINSAAGCRFYEYFERFRGTPWLSLLMTLDVVRAAAIPINDIFQRTQYPPLQCVTRVRNVELLDETPVNSRLPVRVDLDIQGIGRWQNDLSIYMPTREQMERQLSLSAEHRRMLKGLPPSTRGTSDSG